MTSLLTILTLLMAGEDPRAQLVDLQSQGRAPEALQMARVLLDIDPEGSRELGVDYLEGRLLERLDRPDEAVSAYLEVMSTSPALRPYALLRIAGTYINNGHPELAAGLLTTLLREPTPEHLLEPANRLLASALRRGGDCRVLVQLSTDHLPESTRRSLHVSRIDCNLALGAGPSPAAELLALLESDGTDLPAGRAAESFATLVGNPTDPRTATVVGTSLHHHRQFDLAARFLERAIANLPAQLAQQAEYETYYQLVRSWFWQGDLVRAAAGFGELAERSARHEQRSRALYQQGRSYELAGDWTRASASYRRCYLADPTGRFSSAALISALRIEWRAGQEARAADIVELLPTRHAWSDDAGRAALFLAVSDVVRGRTDRAEAWLTQAESGLGKSSGDVAYWRARLAELGGNPRAAVRHYLELVAADPYHLLSASAATRLRSPALHEEADATLRQLSTSSRSRDLHLAWRLLGTDDEDGALAQQRLIQRLGRNRGNEVYLSPEPPDAHQWPIWQASLRNTEEKLLALGLWNEGQNVVLRHFPVSQPLLAMTAGHGLAGDGRTQRALYIAEILRRRVSRDVPDALLDRSMRELLYPFPYRSEVTRLAAAHGIDPSLLLAIVREESRFDPDAVSPASARGLGQLTLPTARRVADQQGIRLTSPDDLLDPYVSLELAAAYLGELTRFFGGNTHQVVAAYNAGERQAGLWQSHCYSREPEEYFAKVGFSETHAYLARVLRAKSQYEEIYAGSRQ